MVPFILPSTWWLRLITWHPGHAGLISDYNTLVHIRSFCLTLLGSRYESVGLPQNTHIWQPIARPLWRKMGFVFEFKFWSIIYCFFRGALCNILFHCVIVPIMTLWKAYQVNGVQFHQKAAAKMPATRLFRQQVVQANPCYWHFVRRTSGDWWISPHKRVSNAESVPRHDVIISLLQTIGSTIRHRYHIFMSDRCLIEVHPRSFSVREDLTSGRQSNIYKMSIILTCLELSAPDVSRTCINSLNIH